MRGISNILFGGNQFFIDKFRAQDDGIVWLHGYGNVFEITLAAGEDRFDCVLGVLCVLNVLAGNRPDTAPDDPWIRRWEGWVLGQTALPIGAIG